MPKLSQVVPNFARATLLKMVPNLANLSVGPRLPQFNTDDLVERLIVPVYDDDPDTDAAIDITDKCDAFIMNHDWAGLANYLTEFDQSRAAVPSGKRLLEVVLHFLRDNLSEMYETPNAVNYETSFVYASRLLDAIEAAHLKDPDNYMLAAILARFHLDCAWSARRAEAIADLKRPKKSALLDHAKLVQQLITRFDPIAYNSPLLGEIQYSYVALMDPDQDRMKCAFDDWVELDPANLTAYRHHAFFMHKVHGTEDDTVIEAEARRAITLGEEVMGDAAYAVIYLQALQHDPMAYDLLDPETFTKGFDDLMIGLNKDPMRLIYLIEQIVEQFPDATSTHSAKLPRAVRAKAINIRLLLAPVFRKYLTGLYAVAWDLEETDFLQAIAPSFADELARGATVEITEGGELITEAAFAS